MAPNKALEPMDVWMRKSCRTALCVALLLSAASPVPAQTPVSGFSGLSGANSKKPIDIESDSLEVDDKRHLAIFIGNVSATQGDYNLKAPRLEVTYENSSQQAPDGKSAPPEKTVKAPPASASGDPMQSGQIKFIHALGGPVFIKSQKDDQEATGDDAVYDVKAQKVTLTGKKVVLTQKKNIVEGKMLIINLDNGQAKVIPFDEVATGASAPQKGRVRAILNQDAAAKGSLNPFAAPRTDDAAQQKQSAPAAKPTPGAGWQAQSR